MSKNQKHIESARRLEEYLLSEGIRLPHRKALEAVARVENERNWNMLAARAGTATETASTSCVAEVKKAALPAFDFLPQHYKVTRLLELCTKLLAKTGIPDTPEFEQAVQHLREFESVSVWGEWAGRDLEQCVEGYGESYSIEDMPGVNEEPVRTALKCALHRFADVHETTGSDMDLLDTLICDALYEHYNE